MQFISEISINNFRSIKEGKFFLAQYTPLVGYNNAGKSNLIQAIKWFIKPYSLLESDFNDSSKRVEIVGTIEGITQDILNNLTQTNQTKIKKFLFFNKIKFKRIQEAPGDGAARIKLKVLDYGYGYIPDVWKSAPTGLPNALKEMFPDVIEIGAMENAVDDASKYKKSNTIGKLISEIIKPIQNNYTEEFNRTLEGISKKINGDGSRRLKELKKFDKESTSVLNDFFPGIGLKVHIPTPNIQDLFQNSLLKVEEDGYTRNLQEYGHGTQRSIQMALVKYLSDIQTNNSASTSLLLIDEPELYLHPQAVEQTRIALKKLSQNGYQVVFSTHSPQMIVSEDVLDTLLIRKDNGATYSRKRMREALSEIDIRDKHKTQFELIMSLTNSNQILFSEKVVLIEGTTELRLFPTLFEKKKKRTLSTSHIALIEQNSSSSTQKMITVLKSMDLPTKVIVDLDFAFRGAVKNNYLTEADIEPCKLYLAANKPPKMFLTDGFPSKKKGDSSFWTAAEGFEWLASQETMKPVIESIHQKLKQQNIWIWTKGAIEKHLNLKAKDEKAWMNFLEGFGEKSFGRYIKDAKVKEMLDWIDE